MRRLYDSKISGNAYKARLLLAQLDLPYERIGLDILRGESLTPEFKAKVHHSGRVPVLEDDGFVLAESGAILCYLARGTDLFPDEPKRQARILEWMFFEQNQLELGIGVCRYFKKFKPDAPRAKEFDDAYRGRGEASLRQLEEGLKGKPFLVEGYSIADIALYGYAHLAPEGGFSLEGFPNLRAWMGRIEKTPRYVAM